jgi:hypothetical protein
MDLTNENGYVVFVRADQSHPWAPERAERRLARCSSYQEAKRIQAAHRVSTHQECVIRYEGIAGGGD